MNARTILATFFLSAVAMIHGQQPDAKLAPFTSLRWLSDDAVEAQIDGNWHRLAAIDGVSLEEILGHCKAVHRSKWQRRFGEDLVQVMREMGHPVGATVDIDVEGAKRGKTERLAKVPMTAANRARILDQNRAAGEVAAPKVVNATLTKSQVQADLDFLRAELSRAYSYAERTNPKWREDLDALVATLPEKTTRSQFGLALARFLARFGDGHTRLETPLDELAPAGYLPCLIQSVGDRAVAFLENRSGFVAATHPYVKAIDGVPTAKWIAAAEVYCATGSEHFVAWNAARMMRHLGLLRADLALDAKQEVAFTLEDEKGRTKEVKLDVASRRPIFGDWPERQTGMLAKKIGYLRIPSMDDDERFLASLDDAMRLFAKEAKALVIDVRGNGGGTRDALMRLMPWFMRHDDEPFVANVAAYRIPDGERRDRPEGFLENRTMFPLGSRTWSAADRAMLEKFSASFAPRWKPPEDDFSAWHFLVMRPGQGDGAFSDRPVKLLMDSGCFSATDIFLSAFKGRPRVELVGTPSGGGSGRARRIALPNSGLELQASTMASFRPDGVLLDGHGVDPDRIADIIPTDLIGKTDSVLDVALSKLE